MSGTLIYHLHQGTSLVSTTKQAEFFGNCMQSACSCPRKLSVTTDALQEESDKNSKSSRYFLVLQDSILEHAAYDVAAEIIRQAFQHFPSPSGKYGEIAIGRE